jgi:uncharacterized DUF497 family protein
MHRPSMRFEWDERKRQANIEKHGFDFIWARQLFDGRPRFDLPSPRRHEHRILSIGEIDGAMVAAVWTPRPEDTVRIISVRRARGEEERQYRQLQR